jgi:hypothetical protein
MIEGACYTIHVHKTVPRMVMRVCGGMTLAAGIAWGGEFPLRYRALTADEVAAFPRGYGSEAVVRRAKPAGLKTEPPASSACPLYGELAADGGGPFRFRLDESQSLGKGYDRLIIDLNRNADLTDDPVVMPAAVPGPGLSLPEDREEMLFGPIAMPADGDGNRPAVCFAQSHLYNRRLLSRPASPEVYFGQLRLKAGWCLEASIRLPGIRQRVAVVDNNGDLRLGEAWRLKPPVRSGQGDWDLGPGDSFLQCPQEARRFENRLFTTECSPYPFTPECSPFGPILYFGARPWSAALSADSQSLRLEPWRGPLAELAVQPNGNQVRSLTLAWENPPGQWQLIKPAVLNGKALVPPGNYRLYGCLVEARAGLFHRVRASAFDRGLRNSFTAEAGKVSTIQCGAPMRIQVTAKFEKAEPAGVAELGATSKPGSPARVLRVSAQAVGAGGETYSAFGFGRDFSRDSQKRGFIISRSDGKEVASGNLEFG